MNTYFLVPVSEYEQKTDSRPTAAGEIDKVLATAVNRKYRSEYEKAAAIKDSLNSFINMSRNAHSPPNEDERIRKIVNEIMNGAPQPVPVPRSPIVPQGPSTSRVQPAPMPQVKRTITNLARRHSIERLDDERIPKAPPRLPDPGKNPTAPSTGKKAPGRPVGSKNKPLALSTSPKNYAKTRSKSAKQFGSGWLSRN